MRARRELAPPFMQVDLLGAEGEGEPLFGRRPERHELHAEHFRVEADAGRLVARGEDDVVEVVDHASGRERDDAPAPPVMQLLALRAARSVGAVRAAGGAAARAAARGARLLTRARAAVVSARGRRRATGARLVLLDARLALSAGHAGALARRRCRG